MADYQKKRKRGSISEEDVSTLLQRYSTNSVLALLHEVAQVAGEKIDWNEMVKNTATGICSARELQVLWRHIAYGQTLIDRSYKDAEPLDNDSDLEYELEAFPVVSREASVEAAACVKVLIASNDSHLPNNSTMEAPLTINVPNIKSFNSSSSDHSLLANTINISIPVSVQKQTLSSCEKRPVSGANFPPRRRRSWSEEEDKKLTDAVKKYGERNWANIARGDFNNDRKPSELSQRWSSLRKKHGNFNMGPSSQPSETQLAAAHRAMSLALDRPMGDNLKNANQMSSIGSKSHNQPQKSFTLPSRTQPPIIIRPPSMTLTTPGAADPMVKAAAVAAGARIATQEDASSLLFEAAHSPNVVHITTGGNKSSATPTTITSQLPSNVHFIRNGLAKAPISTHSAYVPNVLVGTARVSDVKSETKGFVGLSPLSNQSEEKVVEKHHNGKKNTDSSKEELPSTGIDGSGEPSANRNEKWEETNRRL